MTAKYLIIKSLSDKHRSKLLSNIKKEYKVKGMSKCWIWQLHTHKYNGYAIMKIGSTAYKVHRLFYFMFNGSIDRSKYINHHCDITNCVNPEHLYSGTPKQNSDDKYNRGRQKTFKGTEISWAILKEQDVIKIIQLLKLGLTTSFIAGIFNVSPTCIYDIKVNKNWKHIPR